MCTEVCAMSTVQVQASNLMVELTAVNGLLPRHYRSPDRIITMDYSTMAKLKLKWNSEVSDTSIHGRCMLIDL